MNDSDTDANGKAIDSLLNFETVKYFSAERRETARYDVAMAKYEKNSVRAYQSLAVLNFGQALIFSIALTIAMWMCVDGIRSGRNTIGDFVLINALLIQLYTPLNFMGTVYREIKQATLNIEEMFALLGRDPEILDKPGAPALKVAAGEVRFEDVHFAYVPERKILKGISFTVPPGKTVAIVGPSGAGKSTISRLLFRFYEPNAGRVLIDGQDIASVTQASLRASIGMVPQDTVLFNDTIGYNIAYGRDGASDEDVRAAAAMAQIDRFIAAHLPASEREFAIARFLHGTTVAKMREAVVKRAFQLYGFRDYSEPDRWLDPLQVLDILLRVALTNGAFTVIKRQIIEYTRQTLGVHNRAYWVIRDTIAHKLGVHIEREGVSFFEGETESERHTTSRPAPAPTLSRIDALARLGLSESASSVEVKATYRGLVKRCHPDLVAAKGDDAAIRAAALNFCEIQEAYDVLSSSLTS
jgi:ABC-type oligopeptide transport system ATPase subunit